MSGLFTVLIAEKEHINAIQQENKLFFEPFLKNKELVFCEWNPAGQNLQDSVPGLSDAVCRRKEWRAVIIQNCTAESIKSRNPFDTVDHRALDALVAPARQLGDNELLADWDIAWGNYSDMLTAEKKIVYQNALKQPLAKLATWLCFKPEDYVGYDVQEKQDVHDWAMSEIGRDDLKLSAMLEKWEREQYKKEYRAKEELRKTFVGGYRLNIAYPSEVYCISPRTAESSFFDPNAYWTIHQDNEYSAFADRNMYFDKMRFMVFDMLADSHRNYRTDYIRFLASVLIVSSNPVPGSAMQARHLYQLETDTNDAPLCTLVTSFDKKLASTYDVIENEMERIRSEIPGELTDKAAEALFCTPKEIPVSLDESCEPDKAFAETDYGLFFDSPEDEQRKWERDRDTSKKSLAYIVKQQLRSVRKGVNQMHLASEVSDVNISRLSPLQIDDIREYTNTAEDEMVASIPPSPADLSQNLQRLSDASEEVKKMIRRRMTKKTVAAVSVVCLGLLLVCFLPFLFANNGTAQTITTAVILTGSMLGVLAVIMLISLLFLRGSVTDAVKTYNETAQEVLNSIQLSLKRFSKYLGASCNVRRGHSVQNYAHSNLDEYTKSLRIRKRHQEDIRRLRACLKEEYGDYLGDPSYCDETMCHPYDYDFDKTTEYSYPAPFLAGDCRQIEFISAGNYVTAPSSYVTRISVRMEGIYE